MEGFREKFLEILVLSVSMKVFKATPFHIIDRSNEEVARTFLLETLDIERRSPR